MALDTVSEYVSAARVLLNDETTPYRYSDVKLLLALNMSMFEARAKRPDLFIDRFDSIPQFAAVDSTAVTMDRQARLPLVYFMVGHTQLLDDEEASDARATVLLNKFIARLMTAAG